MKNLRHILVAIKNPRSRSQPALRKAAQLAQGSGARLTLFHALDVPLYLDAYNLEGQSLQQAERQWRTRVLAQLEKLAAPLRAAGLTVGTDSDWDFPAYEAVIRRAHRAGADLIVAERHASRHLLPALLRFNDWELLRRSPVPVLLIKHGGSWHRPAVLATIDPTHGYAKPARLDAAIMAAASLVAGSLAGRLHIAHAWPGTPLAAVRLSAVAPQMSMLLEQRARRATQAAFKAEIEHAGLGAAKRHFIEGNPAEVIPRLARRQRAGIVVMGAISRSGLKRLVLGNVAEQVLDALRCDVLVVKPASFKARVRPRGRGVQLIPTPPYI
ncbi:MAG TPA: universal stress protein [Steroidobacteraceae bacterium]|nr:universal stress protein [Steroidobacteraceae bacterium]